MLVHCHFVFKFIFGNIVVQKKYFAQKQAILAQLVERIHGKDEVLGSIPRDGSNYN